MTDGIDPNKLNMKGLVEYHNTINPDKPVKSFKSRQEGIDAVKRVRGDNVTPITEGKNMETQAEKPKTPKVPPKANVANKEREKRVAPDMTDPKATIDMANNRKEIVVWHGHNENGLVARWDKAAAHWVKKADGREIEKAPGRNDRDFLERFATIKGWPKVSDLKAAIATVEEAITVLSK